MPNLKLKLEQTNSLSRRLNRGGIKQGEKMQLSTRTFIEICAIYDKPGRDYHNSNHIRQMSNTADTLELTHKIHLSDEQEVAILLHDIVYVPGQIGKNEFESTLFAKKFCDKHLLSVDQNIVSLCILSTIEEIPLCRQAELVVDLDLSILSSDEITYQKYVDNIRKEYSYLSDEEWKEGRAKFLEKMLKRSRIFWFDGMSDLLSNDIAKRNMENELARLKSGSLIYNYILGELDDPYR